MARTPLVDQLFAVRDQLRKLEMSGAGRMPIIPRVNTASPTIESFEGEDYIAWPYPQYTAWFSAFRGAAQQAGAPVLKWPFGEGMEVGASIDAATKEPDKIYLKAGTAVKIKLLPSVVTARRTLDRALTFFDPSFRPEDSGVPWKWILITVGVGAGMALVATRMTRSKQLPATTSE